MYIRSQKSRIAQNRLKEKKRAVVNAFIRGVKTNRPCMDCGKVYPYYVMDFDHVRGEKQFSLAHGKKTMSAVRKEIEKCELVCANCHRERTFSRLRNGDKPEEDAPPPLATLWVS